MKTTPDPRTATSTYRLQVRFAETDLMGVVHHANYLLYCEAARVDWLHKRGVSYQAWVAHGIHLPVAETHLRYKQAARFDDILDVHATVAELSRVTVLFRYEIRCAGRLLCLADTLLVSVGDDMKIRRLPEEVAHVFLLPEQPPTAWAARG